MAQVTVNFRTDKEVKQGMDSLCKKLGLTPSTAYNLFARKMIREQRIPFEVSYDPFYSESNIRALDESLKQFDEGKTVVKTLDDLKSSAFFAQPENRRKKQAHLRDTGRHDPNQPG